MTVTDNFDRADGGLGANWTSIGTAPVIASNKARATAVSTSCRAAWSTAIGDGTVSLYVECTVVLNGGGSYTGPLLSEANNSKAESYGVVISNDGTEVYLTRTTGGTDTDIATANNLSISNGVAYRLRLEWWVGGTVKVYLDGAAVGWTSGSGSDTAVTPSYAGIQFYTASGSLDTTDNFEAGELNQSVTAQVGTIALTGIAGSPSTGGGSPQTVTAQVASLTLAGVQGAPSFGNVTQSAQVGTIALAGSAGTATPGAVTQTAQVGTITLAGIAGVLLPGNVTKTAQVATLTLSAIQSAASGPSINGYITLAAVAPSVTLAMSVGTVTLAAVAPSAALILRRNA